MLWITGTSRTGKTSRLTQEFCKWVRKQLTQPVKKSRQVLPQRQLTSAILVFAANNNNRRKLADRLSLAVEGTYPVICKTPVGFISDEVMLFWPLLFEQLKLKAQFPLRLRPETEQELATKLWRDRPEWDILIQTVSEYRLVRQTLDLLQLAGASGIPAEDIPTILEESLPNLELDVAVNKPKNQLNSRSWQKMGQLLLDWRYWCLQRGLLSYGIIYELYWRYLLPNPTYRSHLVRRYQAIFADDVDDYPAIARDLFELLIDRGAFAVFTYNPDGKIRLGLNADPNYLEGLASRCQIEELPSLDRGLLPELATTITNLGSESFFPSILPDSIQSIQTISRAELLRTTADIIIQAVKQGEIQPAEIALIAPGLDEIARYSLIEMLSARDIPVEPLSEQRPLISSPAIRALLTLLALVYPGLGRLVDRDAIAEMLVILSRRSVAEKLIPDIDPVRAGLLADYCYHIDPDRPYLLPIESFSRWDRLGHKAGKAYSAIALWIEKHKSQLQEQSRLNPILLLDRAIQHFFSNTIDLPYDLLAALRELMETAQHFWEVDRRLRQNEPSFQSQTATVAQFIQLLRRGTITANPLPLRQFPTQQGAVTLANIFQYRSLRSSHRWQFWLDVSSHFWNKGGAATLFAAPLFLQEWSGRSWMPEDDYEMDKQRLQRIVRDLLARAEERVFLCHSDLGVNGTEQTGPLLSLVHASTQFVAVEQVTSKAMER
ncbi:MAG: recombinase family protein [Xenococcaceae cyanobacterium MO_188.B32]|nr:recombinase family protein [Xenococcaceae cyanobacterium MO_188.B32]